MGQRLQQLRAACEPVTDPVQRDQRGDVSGRQNNRDPGSLQPPRWNLPIPVSSPSPISWPLEDFS